MKQTRRSVCLGDRNSDRFIGLIYVKLSTLYTSCFAISMLKECQLGRVDVSRVHQEIIHPCSAQLQMWPCCIITEWEILHRVEYPTVTKVLVVMLSLCLTLTTKKYMGCGDKAPRIRDLSSTAGHNAKYVYG
jgi:hypothetical protein